MYDPMSCSGMGREFMGTCSQSWIGFAIVSFLCLIVRRQTQDGVLAGMGFNFIASLAGGLGLNILLTVLTGDIRWSLLAGIAGVAVFGFGTGLFLGGSEGEEY